MLWNTRALILVIHYVCMYVWAVRPFGGAAYGGLLQITSPSAPRGAWAQSAGVRRLALRAAPCHQRWCCSWLAAAVAAAAAAAVAAAVDARAAEAAAGACVLLLLVGNAPPVHRALNCLC